MTGREKHTTCECEHESHFPTDDGIKPERHNYGERLAETDIKTAWGTFHVCQGCKDVCWGTEEGKQYLVSDSSKAVK